MNAPWQKTAFLPTEIAIQWFAILMQGKLNENAHKGNWDNCEMGYLRRRLSQEVAELKRALDKHKRGNATAEDVRNECADVANFAMMIADTVYDEGE